MKHILISITLLCITLFVNGQCVSSNDSYVIQYPNLEIEYNIKYYIPNYVIETLTPNMISGNAIRHNDFHADANLIFNNINYITPSIYENSGFDKGHLAPAADFKYNQLAMRNTFSMANMAPQYQYFNRHTWANLENNIRKILLNCDTLFVITGSILDKNPKLIHNKVAIPKKFYKAIIGKYHGDFRYSCAWIYANNNSKTQSINNTKHSIYYLEQIIHKNLFKINIPQKYKATIIYF